MATITQDMRFRLSLIRYAQKHGVTKAAVRYRVNRQFIYRWMKRYDGSWESLSYRSRRPHSHPNQHTPKELKLISDMRRRNQSAGLLLSQAPCNTPVRILKRIFYRSPPRSMPCTSRAECCRSTSFPEGSVPETAAGFHTPASAG